MLVGKRDIDIDELIRHSKSTEEFLEYADSLVPEVFRKVPGIVGNQRYLCCIALRNTERISWDRKKEILPILFSKSKLCGYVDTIMEVNNLIDIADMNKLIEYGRRENVDVSSISKKYKRRV